jgi:hypothetical protein
MSQGVVKRGEMESVQAFIKLFAKGGRSLLHNHPVPSLLIFLLGMILAHFYYRKHIDVLEQRSAGYQERLDEVPQETIYTKLTNKNLKREASTLVKKLRDFHQETEKDETEQLHDYRTQSETAQSDTQRQALHHQYIQRLEKTLEQKQERFRREFITPIQALTAAIRERQPQYEKQHDDIVKDIIMRAETLAGANPIQTIANSLEKQAALLPEAE